MTLTIEIQDSIRKSLENLARQKGKRVDQVAAEIIGDYVSHSSGDNRETFDLMRISESSFNKDWNNDEDAVYDDL